MLTTHCDFALVAYGSSELTAGLQHECDEPMLAH